MNEWESDEEAGGKEREYMREGKGGERECEGKMERTMEENVEQILTNEEWERKRNKNRFRETTN